MRDEKGHKTILDGEGTHGYVGLTGFSNKKTNI